MRKGLLVAAIVLFSFVYIFVVPADPEWVKLIFKVVPMVLIIMYAWGNRPQLRGKVHLLIVVGLVFSMVGDATLRWFVVGLGAFLVGHLFYIAAFGRVAQFSLRRAASLVILLPFGVFMGYRLVQSLNAKDEGFLIVPVLAYIVVILVMCFVAILTGNVFAIVGSVLFVISDSVLAWNMFVDAINLSGVYVMTTYYGAQFFIATAVRTIGDR